MKRLPVLSLFFLIFYNISIGQSYQVEGVILDASNETPLLSASVIAINNVDSLLASFGITNDSGQFRLNDLKPGSYSIQVTYLGYEAYKKDIVLTEDIGDFDMGNLMLVPKSELIEGVEIEGERVPISIRKDTIVYNADAFKTNPNDNVEDLLKKMPGIEVEEDGTIKAQGEEVQQVLVDGKEFFGNDVKIATQNLPAKAIDEVEVYDKKSDLAEFSGIDDGEREKTINLELKEDYKKGYFGNVKAGYGTDERYDGKLSLNRFDKKTQLSLIGNINNINEQGFSIDSYASFVGGMGNLARGRGRSDLPINRGLSDGFVNTASGGLNYNYEFNKKTELRSNYFINKIENTLNDSTFRENFLSRNSYFSDQTNKQNSSNFNHKINVEIRHDIDSTSDLKVRTGFNFNTTEISNLGTTRTIQEDQTLTNLGLSNYIADGDQNRLNGTLTYRKKFGATQKRIFSLIASGNTFDDESIQDIISDNTFFPGLPNESIENILQNQLESNDQFNQSIRTNYTEPLGKGNYLDVNYRYQNYSNEVLREVFDIEQNDSIRNEALSNHYSRDFDFHRVSLGWNMNKEKLVMTTELAFQHSNLDGDLISENSIIRKSFDNFLPSLRLRYELGSSKNLDFNYQTSVREPSIEQLQPFVDNSDPLNIYVGNPNLKTEYRHQFSLRMVNFDRFSFRSMFANIRATYTKNKIINQKTIDSRFVETTMPINVDNDFTVSAFAAYESPIRSLKIKFRVRPNLSYTYSTLFINTSENRRSNYNTSVNFSIENRNKKHFDLSVGTRIGYNISQYSVDSDLDQDFFNQRYFTDLSFVGGDTWRASTSLDVDVFRNEQLNANQTVPIWKASVSRFLLPTKKIELTLSAFDLLNQNAGVDFSSNLNYTQFQNIESLGRYFMLSVTYNLNAFGQASNGSSGRGPSSRR